jgi:hypothetical protein
MVFLIGAVMSFRRPDHKDSAGTIAAVGVTILAPGLILTRRDGKKD